MEQKNISITSGQTTNVTVIVTKTYKSRWGWHPISYETFLKLKALHKRVWEAWRLHSRLKAWSRKTVHYSPEPPPLDPYFSEITENRDYNYSSLLHYHKNEDGEYEEHYVPGRYYHPEDGTMYNFNNVGSEIVETMRIARTPVENKVDVKEIPLSEEDINDLYEEVFEEG